MSEIILERSYKTASELLAEDESIRNENMFFNENNPNEPRYMLIGVRYSDADSLSSPFHSLIGQYLHQTFYI
jgi:hypothetical protein